MATNNAVNTGLSGTTGSGNFVGSTSPTLVTPALGTPSAGVLSNCTSIPAAQLSGTTINSGVTASSLTSFGNSPTLVTPNIGAATGTSLVVSGSVTVGNGTGTGTLILNTSDGHTETIQAASSPGASIVVTLPNIAGTLLVSGGQNFTWTVVSGTSQSASVNNGYFANNSGLVTVTLPSTAAVGDVVRVAYMGSGGWKLGQNSGQSIVFGTSTTTTGTGGSLASSAAGDAVEVICRVANSGWMVLNSQGNLTVV